jgi:hypothetical protein
MGFFRVVPAAFALLMPPTLSHPVTHEQEALRPVAAGPAVAVAVPARTGGRGLAYGGGTTVGDPIVMRLSSNGRRLSRVVDQWRADCSSGMGYPATSSLSGNLKISSRGTFAGAASAHPDLGGGLRGVETNQFSGVIHGKLLSGKWHAHADVFNTQSGSKVDDCDVVFNFSARSAARRVYGGSTSESAPAVAVRSRSGAKVSTFRIGWSAPCSPQGFVQFGEQFTNFPVSSGRFGDDFAFQTQPNASGETDRFDYRLHGRVGRRNASGTFQAAVAHRDAGGNPLIACTSKPVTWRAASG